MYDEHILPPLVSQVFLELFTPVIPSVTLLISMLAHSHSPYILSQHNWANKYMGCYRLGSKTTGFSGRTFLSRTTNEEAKRDVTLTLVYAHTLVTLYTARARGGRAKFTHARTCWRGTEKGCVTAVRRPFSLFYKSSSVTGDEDMRRRGSENERERRVRGLRLPGIHGDDPGRPRRRRPASFPAPSSSRGRPPTRTPSLHARLLRLCTTTASLQPTSSVVLTTTARGAELGRGRSC